MRARESAFRAASLAATLILDHFQPRRWHSDPCPELIFDDALTLLAGTHCWRAVLGVGDKCHHEAHMKKLPGSSLPGSFACRSGSFTFPTTINFVP